jgi:hypothetical protein
MKKDLKIFFMVFIFLFENNIITMDQNNNYLEEKTSRSDANEELKIFILEDKIENNILNNNQQENQQQIQEENQGEGMNNYIAIQNEINNQINPINETNNQDIFSILKRCFIFGIAAGAVSLAIFFQSVDKIFHYSENNKL